MAVSSSNILSFILTFVLTVVQGALEPNGMVPLECLNERTFICQVNNDRIPIGWNITGLRGISIPGPFRARPAALNNSRISTNDTGADSQVRVSVITISGFSISDNGGIIQCINMRNNNTRGMATISVDPLPLPPPTNVTASVESCNVTLQWDQPREPADITTSVNCTPPSPGCAECTTSPCNITGLNPSTEYEFTVTLNSRECSNTSTLSTTARTKDLHEPTNLSAAVESCDNITLQWTQPSEPNDITTSVSCNPPSPGCAECTTSPCTITGLSPSTEYVFTVTLNSGGCRTSMSTTLVKTKGLGAPTNLVVELDSFDTVILQWDQPREPADITTSVSCTPYSPGCAECTTSPCTITGLNPSTGYQFTVILNSSMCATSNTTKALPIVGTSPGPLAALAVLVLLIPLIYPLGVLIARVCCFRDKSYCEVFWCCGCCGKDNLKSSRCNSTELMKSPHPREEVEHQNVNKVEHVQFVTDGKDNQEQIGNKQEHLFTYDTVEQLGDNDENIATDEPVRQQGGKDGVVNTGKVIQQRGNRDGNIVTNEPVRQQGGKDGVVSTGNVTQQQGNPDGIQYADLDFSEHSTGRNVIHAIEDPVTYAEM